MNEHVCGLPSLRLGKLRLNELIMLFISPSLMSWRFHWPMQGPQAFAKTVAPSFSSLSRIPSRWIVARTCSEPGVISNGILSLAPAAMAWSAISAMRPMSSYEELVQLPIRALVRFVGQPPSFMCSSILLTGAARSGVCGPTTCGSSVERSMVITFS